ncbi:hypothetical protein, partial [Streptococcus pyogenes]|uniref:hypothetical protein n=1 Tax=Streptococcus pyogenes TaxID=1314 RepID=UPI003D9FBE9D
FFVIFLLCYTKIFFGIFMANYTISSRARPYYNIFMIFHVLIYHDVFLTFYATPMSFFVILLPFYTNIYFGIFMANYIISSHA